MKTFKFSFTGRQARAIGIFYAIKATYRANDIHHAVSLLYKDYEHIKGLKCEGCEIPKTINFIAV